VNEFNVKAADVERVNVVTGEATYLLLCDPVESKRNPRNLIDTQFSIPWAVAVAIAKRKVSIEDFSDNIISDSQILEISNKIDVDIDSSLNRSSQLEPVRIDIKLRNGTQFSKQFDNALGSPDKPMSFEECVNKFKDCSMYSVNPISNNKIDKVVELIEQLEELTDVSEILRAVS
jgi:2-methylcitrate dehydratase PrpD